MKNKVVTAMLCGVLALSMVACGSSSLSSSSSSVDDVTIQAETDKEEVGNTEEEVDEDNDTTENNEDAAENNEDVAENVSSEQPEWLESLYVALKDGDDLEYSFSIIEADDYYGTVKAYGEESVLGDVTAVFEMYDDYVVLYYYSAMSSYESSFCFDAIVGGDSYTDGMSVDELETITDMSMVEVLMYDEPTRVALVNGSMYYEIDGEMVEFNLDEIYDTYSDYITEDGDFSFSYDGEGTIVDYTTGDEDVVIEFGSGE